MTKQPKSPQEILAEALADPARRRLLLESLADDPEAQHAAQTLFSEGDTAFLQTGGGLVDKVRDRIGEKISDDGAPRKSGLDSGDRLGRYLILHPVGAGGMGEVYAAYDPELDRKVAIKVLLSSMTSGRDSVAQERLRREARALAQLSHPNVVAVHDVGMTDDRLFLAMEFVVGCDASEWAAREPRSWRSILDLYLEAGRGLAAAHAAGLVHRDFKPGNVLVGDDGRVLVADFGLARAAEEPEGPLEHHEPSAASARLTRVGAVLGTPAYMAPEQLDGSKSDERSDQFAFCVALWETFFEERPYKGKTLVELVQSFTEGKLRAPPNDSAVPSWVVSILERGLSIAPEDRFPSLDLLLAAFEKDPSKKKRRIVVAASVAVGLSLAGFGVYQQVAERSALCSGAETALVGIWDNARKEAIESAFIAADTPFGEASWATVRSSLDRYAQSWIADHTEACRATRIRGEQSSELMDLKMICLEDRRQELAALTDLFAQADRPVIERATDATAALTSLAPCRDAEKLRAKGPRPPDPEAQAEVAALQARYARAKALYDTGGFEESRKSLATLLPQVDALGYRPLTGEVEHLVSQLDGARSQFEAALDHSRLALAHAIASRDDRLAGRAAATMIEIEGVRVSRFEEAHRSASLATAFRDRLGDDLELEAIILNNEALVFQEEGQLDKASRSAARGLEAAISAFGSDDPRLMSHLNTLANQERLAGQWTAAVERYQQAKDLLVRQRGPNHPQLVTLALNLGGIYDEMGQSEEAETVLREGLQAAILAYGPDTLYAGLLSTTLANTLMLIDQLDEAIALQRRALEIFETTNGPDSMMVVYPLGGLAGALVLSGRSREAMPLVERELAILSAQPSIRPGLFGHCKLLQARATWESEGDAAVARRFSAEARPDLIAAGRLGERLIKLLDELDSELAAAK